MDAKLINKYGNPRSVRYFVKSLEDVLDVVATAYKHISQKADGSDLIDLLRAIESTAVPIPRTLSSHIICFNIPEMLLDSDTRPTNVSGKQPELRPGVNALPRIVHQSSRTQIVKEVRCLYDIVVFQRFFKTLVFQNSDGIKMFTNKRSAEIGFTALPNAGNGYQLTVSFPGTFFKGSAVPTL